MCSVRLHVPRPAVGQDPLVYLHHRGQGKTVDHHHPVGRLVVGERPHRASCAVRPAGRPDRIRLPARPPRRPPRSPPAPDRAPRPRPPGRRPGARRVPPPPRPGRRCSHPGCRARWPDRPDAAGRRRPGTRSRRWSATRRRPARPRWPRRRRPGRSLRARWAVRPSSPASRRPIAGGPDPPRRRSPRGPSSSATMSSTPGTGRPTEVATASSGSPGTVPVPRDASVEVYRTTTGTPSACAWPPPARPAPATHRCRPPAVPTGRRRRDSGRASTSAHWVGTPWATVIRSASMTEHRVGRPPRCGGDHRGHPVGRPRPTPGSLTPHGRRAAATADGRPARTARRSPRRRPAGCRGRTPHPWAVPSCRWSTPPPPGRRAPCRARSAPVAIAVGCRLALGSGQHRAGRARPGVSSPSSTMVTTGRVRSRIEVTSGARRAGG